MSRLSPPQGLARTSCIPETLLLLLSISYHTFQAAAPIYYSLINCLGWLVTADQCGTPFSPRAGYISFIGLYSKEQQAGVGTKPKSPT